MKEHNQVDNLSFLAETAVEFTSDTIGNHIYSYIGQCLKQLNPQATIIVNSIHEEGHLAVTEELILPGPLLDKVLSILGFNPKGKTIKTDASLQDLIQGTISRFPDGLHELSFGTIPKNAAHALEKLLNLGEIYGIAFMIGGRMYANAALLLPAGTTLLHSGLIETFARQASVTLKRIEAESNEEKYRSLIKSIPDMIFGLDNKGRFLSFKASAEELYLEPAFFLGKTIQEVLPPELSEQIVRNMQTAIDTKQTVVFEYTLDIPHKGVTFFEARLMASSDKELVAIVRDITQHKKLLTTLRASEERLHEIVATKDKFFSIIAHDLKSPFNSILGFSNLLLEQVQEEDYEGIESYARIIRNSSDRALNLLKNLLDWSRMQTGRMEFSPEYVDMAAVVREILEVVGDAAQQKSISIQHELPRNVFIYADISMMRTIILNLLSNAIKFTYPNGSVSIELRMGQAELQIMVSDSGMGMSQEQLGKLFRIEESYSTQDTSHERGTGLGLILCHEFVKLHRGEIRATSSLGTGSTFTVSIPNHS